MCFYIQNLLIILNRSDHTDHTATLSIHGPYRPWRPRIYVLSKSQIIYRSIGIWFVRMCNFHELQKAVSHLCYVSGQRRAPRLEGLDEHQTSTHRLWLRQSATLLVAKVASVRSDVIDPTRAY